MPCLCSCTVCIDQLRVTGKCIISKLSFLWDGNIKHPGCFGLHTLSCQEERSYCIERWKLFHPVLLHPLCVHELPPCSPFDHLPPLCWSLATTIPLHLHEIGSRGLHLVCPSMPPFSVCASSLAEHNVFQVPWSTGCWRLSWWTAGFSLRSLLPGRQKWVTEKERWDSGIGVQGGCSLEHCSGGELGHRFPFLSPPPAHPVSAPWMMGS